MRRSAAAGLLLAAVAVSMLLAVRFGSVDISTAQVIRALLGEGSDQHEYIVRQLRLPRALLGSLIGGGLALAGATFQALLRNPLAEPYILGISGGAAAGAVTVLALGLAIAGPWTMPLAALTGALAAIILAFRVAAAADRRLDVRVLLLAGVVVGAFFMAFVALVLSISEASTVRSVVLWMMGSLSGATWLSVAVVTMYTIPAALALLALARPLNLISIGEETAGYLGADVELVKRISFVLGSLITAAGVAAAGVIGFVGLVVPHAVRLVVGSDHRVLLPLSFLAGAAFLTCADIVARVSLAPTELPIGVITSFVGVPFFLLLLRRSVPT